MSLHKAVKCIFSNWPALYLELGENGLSKIQTSGNYMRLDGLLPIMDRRSITFQKETFILSLIHLLNVIV